MTILLAGRYSSMETLLKQITFNTVKSICMFTQKLRSLRSIFTPGKKAPSARHQKNIQQPADTQGKSNVRLLYHRDIDSSLRTLEAKPDSMQHDWWIN